ncbi:MAG: low temperature-induced protein [Chroococcidiopsidaceae cyanobacterium CP_BM_ER_R8_30]|nr:low temperature-induced protein [Chroococcidiopsidaceae cyanobacterium CP_BM_ER_R8_30]
MRSIRSYLSSLHLVRLLVAVCACALLAFSYASPAYSDPVNITGKQSAPEQGEAQLRSIEKGAQDAALDKPYSRKQTQDKAVPGLNEIQGTADAEKMSRPENSEDAISVEDKSKNFLEAITDKVTGRD